MTVFVVVVVSTVPSGRVIVVVIVVVTVDPGLDGPKLHEQNEAEGGVDLGLETLQQDLAGAANVG